MWSRELCGVVLDREELIAEVRGFSRLGPTVTPDIISGSPWELPRQPKGNTHAEAKHNLAIAPAAHGCGGPATDDQAIYRRTDCPGAHTING